MSWQKHLAQGFVSAKSLLAYLDLPDHLACEMSEQSFKTRVPIGFADRMERGNPCDPLLLQVLARQEETQDTLDYHLDPLQEQAFNPIKGLIHKYHGRVLLTLTGACAVNCRYCFRRHFPYQDNNPGRAGWQDVINYIKQDATIQEVILSGGDPLLATDATLGNLLTNLESIPHVNTLRIHTRIPVVLPERIDESFLRMLSATRFQTVVVMHTNHPQELNEEVQRACSALKNINCHLLNQSVFLQGINDKAEILAELSRKLFSYQVLPYYLHLLDKVVGAAHFDMPLTHALAIYKQLQSLLPGYLLPRLARENAGELSKTLVISRGVEI